VDADAAIPGIPITDTVKRVSDSLPNQVLETISRDDLVTVQTPQAFRRVALMEAHRGAGDGTDDAALLERIGATVVVVPGEVANVKVTEPADLVRAREAVKS
jgi:2-C-methyl-D-erythritol 4-phosphate cytidylyltransferase/2-C-methyl-D-erythritol 2,4-cyclodiphosphate synthase